MCSRVRQAVRVQCDSGESLMLSGPSCTPCTLNEGLNEVTDMILQVTIQITLSWRLWPCALQITQQNWGCQELRALRCKTLGTAFSWQDVSCPEATRLWRLWLGDPKASGPFLLTLVAILKVHPSVRAPRAPTKASVSSVVCLRLNPHLSDPRGLILETISFYREISFISEAVSEKIQLMIQTK